MLLYIMTLAFLGRYYLYLLMEKTESLTIKFRSLLVGL